MAILPYVAALLAGGVFGLVYVLIFTVILGLPNPRGINEKIKNLKWLIASLAGFGGGGSGVLYWTNNELILHLWIGQAAIFLPLGLYVGIKYIRRV